MTPKQINEDWFVVQGGERISGPFKTNGEAWRWIDRRQGDAISRSENTADFVFRKMADGGAA